MNTDNVKAMANDLLEILDDLRASEMKSQPQAAAHSTDALVKKFRKFIAQLFLDRPSFSALRNFEPVFKRLFGSGDADNAGALIMRLAAIHDVIKDEIDMSSIDVATRLTFQRSALFNDYRTTRMQGELDYAKSQPQAADRLTHLDAVISMGVCQSNEHQTAVTVKTILDESLPPAVRLEYLNTTDGARELLKKWAPRSVFNTAADLMTENPNSTGSR